MPEGHTVHRLARDHARDLAGRPVVASSPQGRFTEGAARVDGRVPLRFEAYGKHEVVHLDSGEVLHVHLGLIGKWRRHAGPVPPPIGEVRLRLEAADGSSAWDLSGPMLCRVVSPEEARAALARLGPDPLRRDADPARFVARVRRSGAPIGTLLLDQSVIAGVGNVYRAEVLWALGIDPRRPGRSLGEEELLEVWAWLRAQLRLGVRRNRIATLPGGGRGAYHQEVCVACGGAITTLDVAGRRIDACLGCQR